jgi:hypothetical protein
VQIKQTYGDKETFVTKIDCGRADKQIGFGKLINACWYDASFGKHDAINIQKDFYCNKSSKLGCASSSKYPGS